MGAVTDAPRTADSARLALASEAERLAAIQRRSWQQLFAGDVADLMLRTVDLAAQAESWRTAITRPPLATFRVMVAIGDDRPVGFAALGPSDDEDAHPGEDALVGAFVIDPQHQRLGHGSRLLNAVADTLRADRFTRATWWVPATDDPLRQFLTSAGWAPDGAHRTVESPDGAARVKMIRMHTALA